jgi:2-polyprenyl-6-methoxyphenol hydroxylase-like FAD-dependent oxidoreductase
VLQEALMSVTSLESKSRSFPTSRDAPVLIVGGGPTGLIAATELLRRGVACRLIDRLPLPHTTSKSFTLHARTLEMMEHIGIAHRYLENGVKSQGFTFNFKDTTERPTLDFATLPGRYPFILIYNQNETERVLRQHLESTYDFRPEWGVQLMTLEQHTDGVEVTLRLPDGSKQVARPRWVIGADGIRSRVRESLGIAYEGEDYQENVLQMMDVGIQNFTDGDDWIHYFIAQEHFLLVTKLPGTNYRVLISDLGKADRPSVGETRAAFQEYVDDFSSTARLDEPRWATKWRVLKRLSSSYRHGSVFLAGDSAHCHSPSGGSGMNVCMQDSFNLAWKIAMVERGEARASLLDTYESERKPVARQLLEGTHAMHEIIMGHGQHLTERIERTRASGWHDAATARISGMSYHYREQLAALRDATLEGPLAGDRVPDALLEPRLRLFDILRHPGMSLVLAPRTAADIGRAQELRTLIARRWPQVKLATILPQGTEVPLVPGVFVDSFADLLKQWGGGSGGWVALIRPDGYLQLRTSFENTDQVVQVLDDMLLGA